jgi:hypothetical protein
MERKNSIILIRLVRMERKERTEFLSNLGVSIATQQCSRMPYGNRRKWRYRHFLKRERIGSREWKERMNNNKYQYNSSW